MTHIQATVTRAESRIRTFIRKTPLEHAPGLSGHSLSEAFLKMECLQHTRSFKVRGGLNKLLSLTQTEKEKGIVAASTGNHGLAVAYGLQILGLQGCIVLPENASPPKIALLKQYDVELQFHGNESSVAEVYARAQAEKTGWTFISPYNDTEVVGGQGTIGIELMQQLPEIDSVFVPVGGGGLISGIAGYLKAVKPSVRVVGCVPERSPVMHECVLAGRIVEGTVLPTLSDGTAGGVEDGSITFAMCQKYVDDWIRVSEEEIQQAMKWVFEHHALVIEGSAGVSVSAFRQFVSAGNEAGHTAIILCGGNVDIDQFKKLVF